MLVGFKHLRSVRYYMLEALGCGCMWLKLDCKFMILRLNFFVYKLGQGFYFLLLLLIDAYKMSHWSKGNISMKSLKVLLASKKWSFLQKARGVFLVFCNFFNLISKINQNLIYQSIAANVSFLQVTLLLCLASPIGRYMHFQVIR